MSIINERWKTVIHSEENMRDAMREFVDDYLTLVEFWRDNQLNFEDDSTWVHVDAVREEREELESRIQQLEHALDLRNQEYNNLAEKYKQLEKKVVFLNSLVDKEEPIEDEVTEPPREVKRLIKRKKKLIAK